MPLTRAIIFVSHHPSDLLLYKQLAILAKRLRPETSILLFKVNHRYYKGFDMTPYQSHFERIEEFPFITYEKNLWKGMRHINEFKKRLSEARSLLEQFDHIDVYVQHSAWLPVNMLLFFFAHLQNARHITRWNFGQEKQEGTEKDKVRTSLCFLYRLLFGNSYKVYAVRTLQEGKFVDFLYAQPVPGRKLTVVSPAKEARHLQNSLPFPLFKPDPGKKKDMVVIFGDEDILEFTEYVDNRKTAEKKLLAFFESVQKTYPDCNIYYKPHPADTKYMPGIGEGVYKSFEPGVNTQSILAAYHTRIKAVYTVFSTSAVWSSFFGIPSYVLYPLIYNQRGLTRFDDVFKRESIHSRFILPVIAPDQIGTIDEAREAIHYVNLDAIGEPYRSILTQ